jgi:hypothetical protein
VDFRALKALRSPLALDIYCWLTYRMSYLPRSPSPGPPSSSSSAATTAGRGPSGSASCACSARSSSSTRPRGCGFGALVCSSSRRRHTSPPRDAASTS